jgi:hypothetical protein
LLGKLRQREIIGFAEALDRLPELAGQNLRARFETPLPIFAFDTHLTRPRPERPNNRLL